MECDVCSLFLFWIMCVCYVWKNSLAATLFIHCALLPLLCPHFLFYLVLFVLDMSQYIVCKDCCIEERPKYFSVPRYTAGWKTHDKLNHVKGKGWTQLR